jgi:4'-phosphopantetheinyl transferase
VAQCAGLLNADESARAKRFVFEHVRRRFVVGRGMLRRLLGTLLSTPPESFEFETGAHGKPRLVGGALSFNVSHSKDIGLYAFAHGRELGVDVECWREVHHVELSQRFFAKDERAYLASRPPAEQEAIFFACWSRKEAYIKARGDGLHFPLDAFEIEPRPSAPPRLLSNAREPDEVERWSMHSVPQIENASAALCVEGTPSALRFYEW